VEDLVAGVLRCPRCHSQRTLTISFPGLSVKEREIEESFEAVWQVVGARLSLICTVGFSGDSDRGVVLLLERIARGLNIPWFHVGRPPGPQTRPVRAVAAAGARLPEGTFLHLRHAHGAEILDELPAVEAPEIVQGDEKDEPIPADGVWIRTDEETEIKPGILAGLPVLLAQIRH